MEPISLSTILFVPVVMACALGGTVGLIWLIRRFAFKENGSGVQTGMSEGGNNND